MATIEKSIWNELPFGSKISKEGMQWLKNKIEGLFLFENETHTETVPGHSLIEPGMLNGNALTTMGCILCVLATIGMLGNVVVLVTLLG